MLLACAFSFELMHCYFTFFVYGIDWVCREFFFCLFDIGSDSMYSNFLELQFEAMLGIVQILVGNSNILQVFLVWNTDCLWSTILLKNQRTSQEKKNRFTS